MAMVLLVWELGAGMGHVNRLLTLGEGLSQKGHKVAFALRDLETYLRFASRGDADSEENRHERTEIWGHVKALRRRVASLN